MHSGATRLSDQPRLCESVAGNWPRFREFRLWPAQTGVDGLLRTDAHTTRAVAETWRADQIRRTRLPGYRRMVARMKRRIRVASTGPQRTGLCRSGCVRSGSHVATGGRPIATAAVGPGHGKCLTSDPQSPIGCSAVCVRNSATMSSGGLCGAGHRPVASGVGVGTGTPVWIRRRVCIAAGALVDIPGRVPTALSPVSGPALPGSGVAYHQQAPVCRVARGGRPL